jgi:hypothetical protein
MRPAGIRSPLDRWCVSERPARKAAASRIRSSRRSRQRRSRQKDERHEEGVKGVDLGDHGLRPERLREPEGQRARGSGHYPAADQEPRRVDRRHRGDPVDGGGEVDAVGDVPTGRYVNRCVSIM